MKKVAFIGTHGVRKTTHVHGLIYQLKIKGINAGYLGEVARMCPLPINEDRTEDSQRWIFYRQIAEELGMQSEGVDILVGDRCLIDNYAYFVYPFGRREEMDVVLRKHVKTYDRIILVPMLDGEIDYDGVRSTDKEFQKTIDLTLLELLEDFEIPYEDFSSVEEVARHYIPK